MYAVQETADSDTKNLAKVPKGRDFVIALEGDNVTIEKVKDGFIVKSDFNQELIGEMRKIEGAKFDKDADGWLVPADKMEQLKPVVEDMLKEFVTDQDNSTDIALEKQTTSGAANVAEVEDRENTFRQATPLVIFPAVPDSIKQAAQSADVDDKEKALKTQMKVQATIPATLLNGRFVRGEAGIYRRQGEEREVLVDEGDKIRFIDKQMDAFQAGVELAKAKGWKAIEVSGSEKFRAEDWYHAKVEGLDVIGYEPTAQDLKRLERRTLDLKSASPTAVQDVHTKAVLASRNDAQEFALKKDFGVQTVNTGAGCYSGRLLHETDHHIVQDIGRSMVAVHEKRAFGVDHKFDLPSKKSLLIGYTNGKASVKTKEKNHGLSR